VGWRGTVDEEKLEGSAAELLVDAITYGIFDHSHMLAYPIQKPGNEPGRLLNFVWYRNVPAGSELDALMVDDAGNQRPISIHPGSLPHARVLELREDAADLLPTALAQLVQLAEQPFLQAVVDVTVDSMAFGRTCLIGDAAFAARPHAAAGTAKAAENGWALAEAIGRNGDVAAALAAWEPGQLALGHALVERSRRLGELYQVQSAAVPGDPALRFGLRGPGD
jgi:2,6-dihydroxypyridine 3-monooxygenase